MSSDAPTKVNIRIVPEGKHARHVVQSQRQNPEAALQSRQLPTVCTLRTCIKPGVS